MTTTITDPIDTRSLITRWGYLVFLGFVFVGPLFGPTDTSHWILEGSVVVTTIAIYVWTELTGRAYRVGAVILMALVVIVTPLGSGAVSVLPVYAAAFLATTGDRHTVIRLLAALTAVTAISILVSPVPWPYRAFFMVSIVMIWFVGLSVQADISLASRADSLRRENARIAHLATVTERERIARDLHDMAGQTLTALILRAQLVQRLVETDPVRAAAEAEAVEAASRALLGDIRRTVNGWQLVTWDDEIDQARTALAMAGVDLTVDGRADGLAPSVETILASSVRESITNVVRHADARAVEISLAVGTDTTTLTVTDDGQGYRGNPGGGLRGMHERVLAAGGRLRVEGGNGTRVVIELPTGSGR